MEEEGFGTQVRNNLQVDANNAIVADLTMEMAEKVEEVTVLESTTQVETASSQMGEVVTGTQMTTGPPLFQEPFRTASTGVFLQPCQHRLAESLRNEGHGEASAVHAGFGDDRRLSQQGRVRHHGHAVGP